jgi:uncharacterized protein (TIGR04255 family)
MSNIPKNIQPSPIVEAIIDIWYTSNIHSNILIGLVSRALIGLDENYKYQAPQPPIDSQGRFVFSSGNSFPSFEGESVRIGLGPQSINFNIKGTYPGWEKYYRKVSGAISKINRELNQNGSINYTRVGLRYINVFRDKTIKNNLKVDYSIKINGNNPNNFELKSNHEIEDQVIMSRIAQFSNTNEKGFVVDLDILSKIDESDIAPLLETIEKSHQKIKSIFFEDILSSEFIRSLNPTY